jgi:GMP synthase-like glutamine amidotransferase
MAGGKLCQHIDGHHCWHDIDLYDGRSFEVSSTHHQMMLPSKNAKVIAWASKKRSDWYWGEKNKQITPTPQKEYEVLAWPHIRAVGMQYHPEAMESYSKGFKFAAELVDKYIISNQSA